MLEIYTLGGLCIRLDGVVINDIGLRKSEALLVYLAVNDRPIQRSLLADMLWPEHSQTRALTSLRTALAVLRRKLGDYLDISHESVRIIPDEKIYLDIRDMENRLSEGQIDAALACFKGDFLEGFHVIESATFEAWHLHEQERIKNALIVALHESLTIAIDTRDFVHGLSLAQKLLDLDAFDEQAHRGCMWLHTLIGDRTAALIHYQKCVEILRTELGIKPQKETQALFEMISRGKAPTLMYAVAQKHNLPESTTSFVGRRTELFQIKKMINDHNCRLLSLVGPGGSGKTRLAIEGARLTLGVFPDGTFFVPLGECLSGEMIIPAIAKAMNFTIDTFTTQLDPEIQLLDFLRRRKVLLILDGFEGLFTCAVLLGRMLEKVQGLKILVTSRQRLNLQGEWPYYVEGLALPEKGKEDMPLGQVEAVQLFIERGTQVKSTFHPNQRDCICIVRICQMVEGMPLAIELAAAWAGVMSVEDIERGISSNLDFLMATYHDVPKKHHSIRAVFSSTWALLTEEQKYFLKILVIFESSFDQWAATAITQGDLRQLLALVEKSLVRCDHQRRFSTHNLIRIFVYEKLAQDPLLLAEVQQRYCHYYLNLLTEREVDLMGAGMETAHQELRQEFYHIRTATRWAIVGWDQITLQRILTSTLVLYAVNNWFEGMDAFRHLIELKVSALVRENHPAPEQHPVVLWCQAFQAFLQTNLGQIDESEKISRTCLNPLQALGFRAELSVCLHNLGTNASFRGEYETAIDLLEEAIILGRESDFILWPTYLLWLGHAYLLQGEYESGLTSLLKCRDLFMRNDTLWGAAFAISKIGLALDGLGKHEQALDHHQDALSIFEEMGNIAGKGYSLSRMSMSACFIGNYHLGIRYAEEAFHIFDDIGHRWGLSSTLTRWGFAHLGRGDVDKAYEMFRRGLKLSQTDEMAPLSLYSLAGIAFVMLREENNEQALDLLSYILEHPKTPMAYLDQPLGLLEPSIRTALEKKTHQLHKEKKLRPVTEVIEDFLPGL